LGAERLLAAEKAGSKIADVLDLEQALVIMYYDLLEETEPERILYLAIEETVFESVFNKPPGRLMLKKNGCA
jgi:hypothetical protein